MALIYGNHHRTALGSIACDEMVERAGMNERLIGQHDQGGVGGRIDGRYTGPQGCAHALLIRVVDNDTRIVEVDLLLDQVR